MLPNKKVLNTQCLTKQMKQTNEDTLLQNLRKQEIKGKLQKFPEGKRKTHSTDTKSQ